MFVRIESCSDEPVYPVEFISEVLRFEVLGLDPAEEDFYKAVFRDIEIGELDAEALRFRPFQVKPETLTYFQLSAALMEFAQVDCSYR